MQKQHTSLVALAVLLTGVAVGCKNQSQQQAASTVKTDLGPTGNADVVAEFAQYKAKTAHCAASGSGKRVILTGFGLFTGANFNPSGAVVSSFADPTFQPSTITLGGAPATSAASRAQVAYSPTYPQGPVATGATDPGAYGGDVVNREITIDGDTYEVCFLTLDVLWDLAGAIIVHEANQFQPQMIMMSGRNGDDGAVWESGAKNDAGLGEVGYNSDGSAAASNAPLATPILSAGPTNLNMTWDNQALLAATQTQIAALGFNVTAPTAWRDGNDYVCNNVSYVSLAAANGLSILLAGNTLSLVGDENVPSTAKIGFFHYPLSANNDAASVHGWINVVATAIKTTLGSAQAAPVAAPLSTVTGTATATGAATGY